MEKKKFLAMERNKYHPQVPQPDAKDLLDQVRFFSKRRALSVANSTPPSVGQAVHRVALECICSPTLYPQRVAEGRYLLPNDTKKPVTLRLVGNAVMVRVGGGWETLRAVLRPLDPCRKDPATLRLQGIYNGLQATLEADAKTAGASLEGHPALFTTRPLA